MSSSFCSLDRLRHTQVEKTVLVLDQHLSEWDIEIMTAGENLLFCKGNCRLVQIPGAS